MGLRACLNRSKKIEKPLRIGSVWSADVTVLQCTFSEACNHQSDELLPGINCTAMNQHLRCSIVHTNPR